ncbi:hypothetical protein [Erwinia tasmaniensis]|uniref:Uncharacterized protein n=1 Tax=Erwinia tasmaniensis (strain DSM 17950 / CFBP 7177 / CIP 109463 / NCPPB 4357 / Et1/99) TaxID=465817 RepID=B2VAZ1_ERWT9|nr:hypothetical protein [Erwinia tasmaniensis]CAO94879.1 Hypothetical protein ETA_pET490370 [Erwinia tasmaniensis Et1/99]
MKSETQLLLEIAREVDKTISKLKEDSYDDVIISLLKCADTELKRSIIAGLIAGVKIKQDVYK